MRNLTISNITKAVGGTYFGPEDVLNKEISDVTLDSRKVLEGSLFIPVKGQNVDGNDFVLPSYEQGALVCFSEKKIATEKPYILVDSCLQALKNLAEFYRSQFSIPVIGITGSVGKTSTKEMIASVLSRRFSVLKTEGNFNNEIGLPLTLLRLREEHAIAVVEMGMSDFGEMERLSKMARPDVCLITNIGPCHLENCIDLDGVLRAKKEIFTYAKKDGAVFLNGDDEKLQTITEVEGKKPVFFGFDEKLPYHGSLCRSLGLKGSVCKIQLRDTRIEVLVPSPGIHMVKNAVAAAAIGEYFGLSGEEIAGGIEGFKTVGNRAQLTETKEYLLYSDCYNANPASMKAALDVMKEALGRKVCILGDMFELGKEERKLHYEVGQYAAKAQMDLLVCVGKLAEEIVAGAKPSVECVYYPTLEEAKKGLPQVLKKGDTILIKASHGMHFEELTEFLKENKSC